MSRRSLTYESRLIKYARRGFAIAVPGLQLDTVDKIRLNSVMNAKGLTKLLQEHFASKAKHNPPDKLLSQWTSYPEGITSGEEQNVKKEVQEESQAKKKQKKPQKLRHIYYQQDYYYQIIPPWGHFTEKYISLQTVN